MDMGHGRARGVGISLASRGSLARIQPSGNPPDLPVCFFVVFFVVLGNLSLIVHSSGLVVRQTTPTYHGDPPSPQNPHLNIQQSLSPLPQINNANVSYA